MTKKEFLSALSRGLSGLPRREREERVSFYREMIDDRIEEGMPEPDAVASVGTVEGTVSQILAERPAVVSETPKKSGGGRVWVIVLLVLGFPVWFPLLLSGFAILFSVFVTAASVTFSLFVALWAVDVAFAAGAVGGVGSFFVLLFTGQFASAFFTLGAGLISGGLAILLFFGAVAATKGLWRGIAGICRWIVGLFKRKEKYHD